MENDTLIFLLLLVWDIAQHAKNLISQIVEDASDTWRANNTDRLWFDVITKKKREFDMALE